MNYFLQAIKEKYALFDGRARRAEFWQFFLFAYILAPLAISLILGLVASLLNIPMLSFLIFLYYLAIFVPTLAIITRRMHDNNKSFWYYFIPIYSFILLCTEGTKGPNEYGPDPKGSASEMATSFV